MSDTEDPGKGRNFFSFLNTMRGREEDRTRHKIRYIR